MPVTNKDRLVHRGFFSNIPLSVAESFGEWGSAIKLRLPDRELCLQKYEWIQLEPLSVPEGRLYDGLTLDEVMASGRDVLGERILQDRKIGWEAVDGLLPKLSRGAYAVIGSHIGWSGITVDPDGGLRAQRNHAELAPRFLLRPEEIDPELGAVTPVRLLVDGEMPIMLTLHVSGQRMLELMHFVEPGEAGKDPTVWTRAQVIDLDAREAISERLLLSGLDMMTEGSERIQVDPEMFWDAFAGAALYWRRYRESFAQFEIPDRRLQRSLYGCMATMAVTFSADHPHYGHEGYGWEIHDHFPPTQITAFEACASLGQTTYARRILDHLLAYCIDDGGRFFYRQGARYLNGAAGSEYGQLLWLVERYEQALFADGQLLREHGDKLAAIGDMLIRNRLPSTSQPDLRLIRMCAEADTNGRVYDYIQNSFWAALGLSALAKLMMRGGMDGGARFSCEAESLLHDAREAVARARINTKFGPLPPFQLDYTAAPLTLSNCRDTFEPIGDANYARYLDTQNFREPMTGGQNYVENVYANYRYYLEMLAARCLDEAEEQAIVNLREQLGGELLGMTRFMDRVDDWPVYNYARYLLEIGRTDKYQLLLYAHTVLHGLPELMIYYEQAGLEGSVIAPDCVPSLLTTPMLLSWMFAFEPVKQDALHLLKGVPAQWFDQGFTVKGLCTRWGLVDIKLSYADGIADLLITLPDIPQHWPVYIHIPGNSARIDPVLRSPGEREVRLSFPIKA